MPYNTRRKSLSLPSLGIHLPVSQASRQAAAAEKLAIKEEAKEAKEAQMNSTPHKRQKSSHSNISSPAPYTPSPAARNGSISMPPPQIKTESRLKYEHTPPPSPDADIEMREDGEEELGKAIQEINLDEVHDDIVEAVIVQLQKTGNRPHLVKELATVLGGGAGVAGVKIVETSANPSAIISSRLSTYLKRSCWNSSSPCPLAKELETVHPRRTYFYLTTYPHQPIPDPATVSSLSVPNYPTPQRSIISPSLSSAESAESRTDSLEDETDAVRRRQLSPSPEVDLSSPEFDDAPVDDDGAVAPPTPSGSFSGRLVRGNSASSSQRGRGASPPLEKDEREFTLTARGLQRRRLNGRTPSHEVASTTEPSKASKGQDLDGDLFGEHRHAGVHAAQGIQGLVSSPAMKPTMLPHMQTGGNALGKRHWQEMNEEVWIREGEEWDNRSPEMVGLDELDGMLYGY